MPNFFIDLSRGETCLRDPLASLADRHPIKMLDYSFYLEIGCFNNKDNHLVGKMKYITHLVSFIDG